ncbi:MAG: glycosyltransferase family 4 protein [Deltaproteobacteria bacterium]|nr:glycosyltransferase family 4 protein [Deltaproteobacteria bacterium]
MRVLHIIHQYLPENVGGTELYTHWLIQELNQRGHQNALFYRRSGTGDSLESRTDESGTQIWAACSGTITPAIRFRSTFGQKYLDHAFRQVLAQVSPDVIHIQHLMGLPVAVADAILQTGIPYVITLHDYWWICANAQLFHNYSRKVCSGPKLYFNCARCALARADHPKLWPAVPPLAALMAWRNLSLRRIFRNAARLIAPTEYVAKWYAEHGASPERVVVVPHGVDSPELPPRPARMPGDPVRFAYIGGLSRQKGVHVLVEAFSGIEKGAELWIAGDESANQAYSASLHELASLQVCFLGKLPRAEVWELLARVDVVVVPALWCETFSLIVSEAFAAGAPVIASLIGPLGERVSDGVDGLLVPPGDVNALREAMLRLIRDPALLLKLRAGIERPATVASHAASIESVYRSALLKPGVIESGA